MGTSLLPHFFNPVHPNISIGILQTVLYTFIQVLTRKICTTAPLAADHFLYSPDFTA